MLSVEDCHKISEEVFKEISNEEFIFRDLEIDDFEKGYPDLLPQLTDGVLTRAAFLRRFNELLKYQDLIQTLICEERATGKIIGTIRFFVEPKYIHNANSVLHFEDLVVDAAYRNRGVGTKLVKIVVNIAKKRGCYKCLADAKKELLPFYEMAGGLKPKEVSIAVYNI